MLQRITIISPTEAEILPFKPCRYPKFGQFLIRHNSQNIDPRATKNLDSWISFLQVKFEQNRCSDNVQLLWSQRKCPRQTSDKMLRIQNHVSEAWEKEQKSWSKADLVDRRRQSRRCCATASNAARIGSVPRCWVSAEVASWNLRWVLGSQK